MAVTQADGNLFLKILKHFKESKITTTTSQKSMRIIPPGNITIYITTTTFKTKLIYGDIYSIKKERKRISLTSSGSLFD